jgi:Na+-transporting methylmalonyl-CoA/oxaloacetate decarboxylase gamma subunit
MTTSDDAVLIISIVFAVIFFIILIVLLVGTFIRKRRTQTMHIYKTKLSTIDETSQEFE